MSANFFELQRYAATGIATPDMTYHDRLKALALFPQSYPSTTITGTPPLSFKANGQPLASWSISGNSQQNGTPTPDAPIYPEFVGERTANLFDITATDPTNGYETGVYLRTTGKTYEPSTSAKARVSEYISVDENAQYCQSNFYIGTSNAPAICFYDSTKTYLNGISIVSNSSFTTPPNTAYIRISYTASNSDIMLNSGSTALPYEPYGYKLPITCGGTTTPIYFGQTQTVRRVKKLVLTGDESFGVYQGTNAFRFDMTNLPTDGKAKTAFVSTHFIFGGETAIDGNAGEITASTSSSSFRIFIWSNLSTEAAFQTYLQQQYANGTPVTVWYVITEPETGIVNEPLMKIGDYADTVASTNVGAPSIPTSKGGNTLTVDTTVQPSSVTITT